MSSLKVNTLRYINSRKAFAAITGNYQEYKNLSKLYAKTAMENPQWLSESLSRPKEFISLFSKKGFNLLKTIIKDKFRIKSKEEYALSGFLKEHFPDKKHTLRFKIFQSETQPNLKLQPEFIKGA